MNPQTLAFMSREVVWYQRNGKYPQHRIKSDSEGHLYVIGDFSWNRTNPELREIIEPWMDRAMKQEAE